MRRESRNGLASTGTRVTHRLADRLCLSGGAMTSRKPPPPAPVTFAPVAPARGPLDGRVNAGRSSLRPPVRFACQLRRTVTMPRSPGRDVLRRRGQVRRRSNREPSRRFGTGQRGWGGAPGHAVQKSISCLSRRRRSAADKPVLWRLPFTRAEVQVLDATEAAMYWSCLPIRLPHRSISLVHARSAIPRAGHFCWKPRA